MNPTRSSDNSALPSSLEPAPLRGQSSKGSQIRPLTNDHLDPQGRLLSLWNIASCRPHPKAAGNDGKSKKKTLHVSPSTYFQAWMALHSILQSDSSDEEKRSQVIDLLRDEAAAVVLARIGGTSAVRVWKYGKMAYQNRDKDPSEMAEMATKMMLSSAIVGGSSSVCPPLIYFWTLSRVFNRARLRYDANGNMPTTLEGKIDYALNWMGSLPDRGVDVLSTAVAECAVQYPEEMTMGTAVPFGAAAMLQTNRHAQMVKEAREQKSQPDSGPGALSAALAKIQHPEEMTMGLAFPFGSAVMLQTNRQAEKVKEDRQQKSQEVAESAVQHPEEMTVGLASPFGAAAMLQTNRQAEKVKEATKQKEKEEEATRVVEEAQFREEAARLLDTLAAFQKEVPEYSREVKKGILAALAKRRESNPNPTRVSTALDNYMHSLIASSEATHEHSVESMETLLKSIEEDPDADLLTALRREIEFYAKLERKNQKQEEALRAEKEANAETWREVIEAVQTWTQAAFTTLHAVEAVNQLKGQMRDRERALEIAQERDESRLERAQAERLVPIIHTRVDFHSRNYLDVWSVRELAAECRRDFQELLQRLEQNEARQDNLKGQLHNIHGLSIETERYYRKAMASKSKLGKGLKISGSIIIGIGAILRCIPEPTTKTVGMACMAAGYGIEQTGDYLASRGLRKLGRKKGQLDQTNQNTTAGLRDQLHQAIGDHSDLKQRQYEAFDLLRKGGKHLPPAHQIKSLNEALKVITKDQKKVQGAIRQTKQSIANNESALEKKRAKLQVMEFMHPKGHNRQKHKLRSKIAALEETLSADRASAEFLQEEENSCIDQVKQTEQAKHDAELLAPLSQRRHDLLAQYEPSSAIEDTPQRKEQREDSAKVVGGLDENLQLHHALHQNERVLVEIAGQAAMNIAHVLGDVTGSDKPGQVVAFARQVYGIFDLTRHFIYSLEEIEKFNEKYAKSIADAEKNTNLLRATKQLHRLILFANVYGPIGQGIFMAWSAGRLLSHILWGRKYGWAPNMGEYFHALGCRAIPQWSPQLEAQLAAAEVGFGRMRSHLDRRLMQLEGLVEQSHESIRKEVREMHHSLTRVCDRLQSSVQSSEALLKQLGERTVFNGVVVGLETKLDKDLQKLKEKQASLKHREDKVEERAKNLTVYLDAFIEAFELILKFNYNGYIPKPHDTGHPHAPQVALTLIPENPSYFSGLIGKEAKITTPLPNWKLFEAYLKKFLSDFHEILEVKDVQHANYQYKNSILERHPAVIANLEKLFKLIHTYKARLDTLASKALPLFLQRVIDCQAAIRMDHQNHFLKVKALKTRALHRLHGDSIVNSLAILERIHTQPLGSRKFYLHRELAQAHLRERIPSWNLLELYKYHTRISTSIKEGLWETPWLALSAYLFYDYSQKEEGDSDQKRKARKVQFVAAVCCLIPSIFNLGHAGLNSLKGDWTDINSEIKYANLNVQFDRELRQPLTHIFAATQRVLIQETPVKNSHVTSILAFDLKQRKIVDISGLFGTQQTPPLFNLNLDVQEPRLGIQIHEQSLVRAEDLSRLPAPPAAVGESAAGYDLEVAKLSLYYALFLMARQCNSPLPSANPFHAIQATSQIVEGRGDKLFQLAFPQGLIDHLKMRLYPALHHLEGTGIGTLIPFYDIEVEGEKLQLSIHFRFLSAREEEKDPENYCRFIIAEFDFVTVRAFYEDVEKARAERHPVDGSRADDGELYQEFLLQAMYGSYVGRLGLPGAGTYELESGLIAPQEVEFPGLYRLWELAPDKMISYRSGSYTQEMSDSLQQSLEKGKLEGAGQTLFYPLPPFKADEGFIKIWSNIEGTKSDLEKDEEHFIREYALFYGLVKLLSNVQEKELTDQLTQLLGVYPPSMRKALYDTWLLPEVQVPQENVQKVVDFLFQRPSADVGHLEKLYGQVQNLASRLDIQAEPEQSEPEPPEVKVEGGTRSVAQGVTFMPSSFPVTSCGSIVGLPNIGNSCYINAVLQSLRVVKPFQDRLQDLRKQVSQPPMQKALLELEQAILCKQGAKVRNKLFAFRRVLFNPKANSLSDFHSGIDEQKDAASFLHALLLSCQMEMSIEVTRRGSDPMAKREFTSTQVHPHFMVPLPIVTSGTSEQVVKFEQLVEAYFNETTHEKWEPEEPGVKFHVPTSTIAQRLKGKVPELLVIQLLRFQRNPSFDPKKAQSRNNLPYLKIETPVSLPANGILDMGGYQEARLSTEPLSYHLKAVVDHHGVSGEGGHYTAAVFDKGHWIQADDEQLIPTSYNEMAGKPHYLYIFERKQG